MIDEIKKAVEAAIPGSAASVSSGSGGHFSIQVKGEAFGGKTALQQQRMVLNAIAHLMKGDNAPVHAIDKMSITA